MGTKGAAAQPAKLSDRMVYGEHGEYEKMDFANRRAKRRRQRDLAKASRKKNRN